MISEYFVSMAVFSVCLEEQIVLTSKPLLIISLMDLAFFFFFVRAEILALLYVYR